MELFDFNQLLVEEVLLQYCRALVANFEIQYDWFGWHVVPNQWLPLACASGLYVIDLLLMYTSILFALWNRPVFGYVGNLLFIILLKGIFFLDIVD